MRLRFFNTYEPVTNIYRDLLPEVVARGWQCDVYLSQDDYRDGRPSLEELGFGSKVRIVRIASGGGGAGYARKALVGIRYAISVATRTLFGRGGCVNVFFTQPPMFAFWGLILKKIRRQPYICVLMDIYPDVAIASGLLSRESMAARLSSAVARRTWLGADRIVVIGRCMRKHLLKAGVPPENLQLIPNWCDENQIVPLVPSQNPLRRKLGLEECFVILYSGNMGRAHYFDDLLAVAGRVQPIPDIKFVFVGSGSRRKEIETAQVEGRGRNLMLMDSLPADELALGQSLGDVHFVSLREEFTALMVPSKCYSALAAGRLIIYQGAGDGELAELLVESDCGDVVEIGNVDLLENRIMTHYRNHELLARKGAAARKLATGAASRAKRIGSYRDVFQELAGKLGPGGRAT